MAQLALDVEAATTATLTLEEALAQVGMPSWVLAVFEYAEIADDVINQVAAEQPDQPLVQRAFAVCCPNSVVRSLPEVFYRAHVRELALRAGRVCTPKEMAAATAAEMLTAFSEASLRAPLNTDAMAAIEHLTTQAGLAEQLGFDPDEPYWKRHEHNATELIADLQAKMADTDRAERWAAELENHNAT